MEAAEDEFQLAGIFIDIAHRIDAGDISAVVESIDDNGLAIKVEAPVSDRPEKRREAI